MGTKKQTETTKVEKPHRDSIQSTEERVLGNVSKVKFSYRTGDCVYFTAFPKKHPNCFFTCKGIVQNTTAKNGKAVYRVQIIEVAEKPIFCSTTPNPKHLLGKIVTKREHELSKHLSSLMTPKKWITQ